MSAQNLTVMMHYAHFIKFISLTVEAVYRQSIILN